MNVLEKIIPITHSELEQQGTKQKFWFEDRLFKIGQTEGENWAEVVAYQLTQLLNLPAAEYGFATFRLELDENTDSQNSINGVYSPRFLNKGQTLVNANTLLSKFSDVTYDPTIQYHHHEYTFGRAMSLIKRLNILLKHNPMPPQQQFIGYLLFDVWIGNQDRHHENWGFVSCPKDGLYLAPTFDHGSSLACRMGIDERERRMTTKDKGFQVTTFATKAKSAFYDKAQKKTLKTYELARLCIQQCPSESAFWINKISAISIDDLHRVLASIPHDRMSTVEKKFTEQFLLVNQQFLSGLLK